MTGLLKDLMHDRADRLAPPALDLEAIARDGERRVRRRRVVGGVSALAAVVTLGALAPAVFDGGDDQDRVAVSEAAPVTWARGQVIHAGERSYAMGHDVHAFVATQDGYVLTDPDGAVWSWTDGSAQRVGSTITDSFGSSAELVSDGVWAGWIGPEADEYVFLNQETGSTRRVPASAGRLDHPLSKPRVFAIDGTTAYVRDMRGMVTIDLTSGDAAVIGPLESGLEIDDVEGGLILHSSTRDDHDVTVAGRDLEANGPGLGVRGGDLSPGGRYVMSEDSATEGDTFTLLQLPDGQDLTPAVAGDYDFFLGYAWSDDNTYTAFGMRGIGSTESALTIDLLTCEVDTRSCVVSGDHPESIRGFEVPVGMHIGAD